VQSVEGVQTLSVLQAGAITFRLVDNSPLILLVRAKKTPGDWIFPKGHIEAGETAEVAAERELAEEAGVRGRSLGPVGSLEFESGHERVRVDYYLFVFVSEVLREETREIRWCSYDEALSLLTHRGAVEMLEKASQALKKHLP
jgi:8-oxo-dGTP pyrophosphatase MutT (NUDIX family)